MDPEEVLTALRSMNDEEVLYRTLFGEARGEPVEVQIGVGVVIRNRAADLRGRWPRAVSAVCLQPAQFSCFLPEDPNLLKVIQPMVAEPGAPHAQLRWVSQGILTGALNDNVHGATHYYDLSIIVGRGQRHDPERLRRYLLAVDLLLAPPASVGFQERDRVEEAQDLIHTLVMDIPPKWDNEVLPVARKGRLIFFKL